MRRALSYDISWLIASSLWLPSPLLQTETGVEARDVGVRILDAFLSILVLGDYCKLEVEFNFIVKVVIIYLSKI
jgi:hypothetical protein